MDSKDLRRSSYSLFQPESQETVETSISSEPRHKRRCVEQSSSALLTEQTLLELEKSQPYYRLAQRNLDHWFYYIESTVKDSFDTYLDRPDREFYPSCFEECSSEVPLSQADFQESHHSLASSTSLFGFTVRSPLPDVEVVILAPKSQARSSSLSSLSSSSSPSSSDSERPSSSFKEPQPTEPDLLSESDSAGIKSLSDSSSDAYLPPEPRRRRRLFPPGPITISSSP
ncbi:hypothetical protein B0O99DRAFT_680143 [Bisporella sp. PMI_857]|nr:hypothetical protein B0O99DRAFT_680143 [Bisporella sp. PMI_857]